jgi:predicted lipoprotein with Yx(FWY)xxD motif
MRRFVPVNLVVVALAATSGVAIASGGSAGAAVVKPHAVVHTVIIESAKLGPVLANSKGRTLYISVNDKTRGKSSCTGECAVIWPPLHITGKPTYGPGVKASLFTVITRTDHTKQLAVNGKPLYTFMSDTGAKQTTGEGVNGFFAVRPNGTKILKVEEAGSLPRTR